MNNIIIFQAHTPKNITVAKQFLANGRKVFLHSTIMTMQLSSLVNNPLVQLRMGDGYALRRQASIVVE